MNLLTNENPLITLPKLSVAIGLEQAMILQQLHYRLQQLKSQGHDEAWYCQSLDSWHTQFPFWSTSKIKHIIRKLENAGLVHSTDKFNRFSVDRTKWYTIDYEALQQTLQAFIAQNAFDDKEIEELTNAFSSHGGKTLPPAQTTRKTRSSKPIYENKLAKKIDEVLLYLNEKTGKQFSLKTQANRNLISGRLNAGYTVEDCKMVIDEQARCWLANLEMEKYLRPMTLFRPSNFESYLNEARARVNIQKSVLKPIELDFTAGEDW